MSNPSWMGLYLEEKKRMSVLLCAAALVVYSHLELVLPDQTWHISGKHCRDLALLWLRRGTCGGPATLMVFTEDLNPIQDPQHNCLPQTDIMWPGSSFLRSELNISLEKWQRWKETCSCHWLGGIDYTWERVLIAFPLSKKESNAERGWLDPCLCH